MVRLAGGVGNLSHCPNPARAEYDEWRLQWNKEIKEMGLEHGFTVPIAGPKNMKFMTTSCPVNRKVQVFMFSRNSSREGRICHGPLNMCHITYHEHINQSVRCLRHRETSF